MQTLGHIIADKAETQGDKGFLQYEGGNKVTYRNAMRFEQHRTRTAEARP